MAVGEPPCPETHFWELFLPPYLFTHTPVHHAAAFVSRTVLRRYARIGRSGQKAEEGVTAFVTLDQLEQSER